MPWIRLESDIGFSESLFGLPIEAKWLWIFILSYSAKKKTGVFDIETVYLSHHTEISTQNIVKHLDSFIPKGLLSYISNTSPNRDGSVPNRDKSVSYERTNERTNICTEVGTIGVLENVSSDKPTDGVVVFDLDEIYNAYPKKAGKKKGMAMLAKKIKTQDDYDLIMLAVKNYRLSVRDTELQYIKQFSTFMNCWEDYVEMEGGHTLESLANIARIDSTPFSNIFDTIVVWDDEAIARGAKNKAERLEKNRLARLRALEFPDAKGF